MIWTSTIIAQAPTNGLVGYWSFIGDFNDYSGNGNHGTTNGCVFGTDRFDNPGSCVQFDGVNDVVTVHNAPSIDFDANNESYSISLWFQSSNPIISTATSARFLKNGMVL